MLIPIGLDNARVSRLPWLSIAILALNVLAFAATGFSGSEEEVEARFAEVAAFMDERAYLELPEQLTRRLGIDREALEEAAARAPRPDRETLAREQQQLERLCDAFLEAQDASPERRFSLVPARGAAQVAWLSHLFMHADLGHLLGNMLILMLLVAPFLEDAWGALFFGGFYLVGGLVAALAQVPLMNPEGMLLGASGAISACLGAFALRFAHRRVRIFYWFFIFVRGTFFVPAWAYALFGAAMDLFALKVSGGGGGVAYAAHVGGFVFGIAVAGVLRATRIEERFAPEGAVRWRDGLALNRAAEALASGDTAVARARLEDALRSKPDHPEALLELARMDAVRFDLASATERIDRVLAQRMAASDTAGARALLEEFGDRLRPDRLRGPTAYRAAELLERSDPERAIAFYEAVGAKGGALGAKALFRAAQRLERADPARARALAERCLATDEAAPEIAGRARELLGSLPPAPRASLEPDAGVQEPLELDTHAPQLVSPAVAIAREPATPAGLAGARLLGSGPVRVVPCRVVGATPDALDLVSGDGRVRRLDSARVSAVAVGLLDRLVDAGGVRRGAVLLDLLLRAEPGGARVVVRIGGHAMGLATLRPGVPPPQAFTELVGALLERSGAAAVPGPEAAVGRPFVRFADLAAYEMACFGRRLAEGAGAGTAPARSAYPVGP